MEYEPDLKWLYTIALLHIVLVLLIIGIADMRGGTPHLRPALPPTETALEFQP